jgi:hypothetical protein
MLSPAEYDTLINKGGEPCIALLRYCVISMMLEPAFVFLVQEYRMRPTHAAALALYDVFCAPAAPARIDAPDALPPRDLRLSSAMPAIRRQWNSLQPRPQPDAGPPLPITAPYKHMFDFVTAALRGNPAGRFAQACSRYDPQLAPEQNLPDGAMNEAQRYFVEKIWRPIARPRLVEAGFWRIANIE